MNQPMIWIGAALILGVAIFKLRRRKKPKSRMARLREGIEGVLDEAEDRTADLRKRANKLRGEAKRRVQEEAQGLESRQQELRGRLDELKAEATKLFEREKARAR
jgi:LPXTG-motif cell wall-anchored protein